MLAKTPKLNPPLKDLIQVPQAGTLTALSSGTGVVAPIEWIREINAKGVAPGDLDGLIAELEDQEAEEDMVSAWPDDTGLPNTIKILPGNPRHGPRIKVALNSTDRFSGDWAWIPFGEAPGSFGECIPCRTGGPLPSSALQRQLHEFIERNRPALFALDRLPDQGGISAVQLVRNLQKIDKRPCLNSPGTPSSPPSTSNPLPS